MDQRAVLVSRFYVAVGCVTLYRRDPLHRATEMVTRYGFPGAQWLPEA